MKNRIAIIVGILFAVVGLVCLGVSIFQGTKNTALLSVGTGCNSIAFVIYCITIRPKKSK